MAIVNVWPLTTTPLRSALLRDISMKAAAVDNGIGLIKSYISVSYINRSDNPLLGRVVGYRTKPVIVVVCVEIETMISNNISHPADLYLAGMLNCS